MGAWTNFVDGFKPEITDDSDSAPAFGEKDSKDFSESNAVAGFKDPNSDGGLKRHLKGRHVQFIALGGSIGTGLFIGSGGALATGGPGFLMVDFILIGIMLLMVVMALGELGAIFPVAGSFAAYSTRFIDPAVGFAMAYNYWLQWLIVLPLELVAASIVISYWDPNETVPKGIWVALFLIIITIINFFGVRGYGEFEFCGSLIKVLAVIGFIIAGIVINVGGGPDGRYYGFKTWDNPGAFHNGFKGFSSVFVTAAFSYAGTELIGLAAAETANARKEIPKAAKQIFMRVIIFYVVSLLIVTTLVPYDNERLGSGSYDARASPFVIAVANAGIKTLPSIFNAVILVSVLSVGNSAVYAASRTLQAMAAIGQAPSFFTYIDRQGRPLTAVIISLVFGLLGFLIYSGDNARNTTFNWLLAISGLSTIISWLCICISHARFRQAWARAGHTLEELPWKSPFGVWGSIYGAFFNILVIIFTFYTAVFPIGEGEMTGSDRATAFFQSFISVPIVVFVFYIPYKLIKRTKLVKIEDIDITTGRKDAVPVEVLRREREEAKAQPTYKKVWNFLF
ncbi:probable GAP1 - amino acid transport protein [Melanopsichium pennsylvanicum]|uniref:Probable GAP1 - amino acid transport protein n=2 Tax=Melanopsichium pennsylvanicum TaxID=63383 RepID=A0AAJ5C2Q6_9BASI|nr:probable GAP1-amino acid transport protein [Melanopsichium pennsylvanicum 4]SNX81659.1 probable GAP1 - amino acid transport protein [Melanopsichium pennsylvanicum]